MSREVQETMARPPNREVLSHLIRLKQARKGSLVAGEISVSLRLKVLWALSYKKCTWVKIYFLFVNRLAQFICFLLGYNIELLWFVITVKKTEKEEFWKLHLVEELIFVFEICYSYYDSVFTFVFWYERKANNLYSSSKLVHISDKLKCGVHIRFGRVVDQVHQLSAD